MTLYIRDLSKYVVYIHDMNELKDFEENYVGTPVVIGDLTYFSYPMRQRLLKFLESNPQIDCYSSYDLTDPVLLSRFVYVKKSPIVHKPVELGNVINYYTVDNGTSFSSDVKLLYTDNPELRNFISACQSE